MRVYRIAVCIGVMVGSLSSGMDETSKHLYDTMLRDGVINAEEHAHVMEYGGLQEQAVATTGVTVADDRVSPVKEPPKGRASRNMKRRRPANRSFATVWPRIVAKVRAAAAEEEREDAMRVQKAERWAHEHGIKRRQMSPSGKASVLHSVDAFGMPHILKGDAAEEAWLVNADELWPTATNGFALSGSNVTVAIWDTGQIRTSHEAFQSRATQVDTNEGFVVSEHTTAVAGTVAAGAPGTVWDMDGIVYDANIRGYDFDQADTRWDGVATDEGIFASCHAYGDYRGWAYDEVLQVWKRYQNPNISTNEDWLFGNYYVTGRDIDADIMTVKYALPVWSAGNERGEGPETQPTNWIYAHNIYVTNTAVHGLDGSHDNGYDTIPYRKTAKNILVVGAVYALNHDTYSVMDGSGWGPTDDGRLAPHVVAPGHDVAAPGADSDTALTAFDGTSPATATAVGVLAQLIQLDGTLNGTDEPLWASTYKALIIHTADKDSSYSSGPDYQQGYGLIDAYGAAELLKEDSQYSAPQHVFELAVDTNTPVDAVVYSDGTEALVATVVWTDPAGPAQPSTLDPTNRVLVNDIDLRISGPYDTPAGGSTGTVYQPWVLDPDNPANAATTGDNDRDNIEQVYIASPAAGYYTIHVTLEEISPSGSTVSEQETSLIVSGNEAQEVLPEFTDVSADTNGVKQMTWLSNAGVIEYVACSTNLSMSNGWSRISAERDVITPVNSWDDTVNTNEQRRFYRIERYR